MGEIEQNKSEAQIDPRLVFKCAWDAKQGADAIESISLASGEILNQETRNKFLEALKNAAGSQNLEHVFAILSTLAQAMPQFQRQDQLNHIATLLPLTEPQDKIEAMLFGQFIALHEAGLRQLGSASRQGVPIHQDRSLQTAAKLLNTANLTMQTLIKYRSKGEQRIQVVHVQGGQTIVAQTLQTGGGEREKK